ncbi:MAG: hypothetical protein A4E40_01098 [Methanoregulaceae archaeon PtaU1.Bin059]|nr:MAG: hypothetical protein A4E40_01098 [Methanoregulaceae archaeon PtaU1.Bin059]
MHRSAAERLSLGAVFFLCAILLVVVPLSAAENAIPMGGTVFVGEENLDITATGATQGAILAWYGTGGQVSHVPSAQVTVGDPTAFYASPITFAGKTGPWFLLPDNTVAFYLEEPHIEIRVVDYSSGFVVSPAASWVPKGDAVGFRIDTNLWVMANRPNTPGAPLKIRLNGPDSLVFSSLGGFSLENLVVSSSPFETGPVWATGSAEYPVGEYTVYARCDANGMSDNYPAAGKAISEKVSFLLQRVNPLITGTTPVPATTPPQPTITSGTVEVTMTSPAPTATTAMPTVQETGTPPQPTPSPTPVPGFGGFPAVLGLVAALVVCVLKQRSP